MNISAHILGMGGRLCLPACYFLVAIACHGERSADGRSDQFVLNGGDNGQNLTQSNSIVHQM